LQGTILDKTSSIIKSANDQSDPVHAIAHDLASLLGQIGTMETFIKRRFDEISMEINATSQQIDMSEDGMAKRFGEILGVMNAISYQGDGTTPANTGVELEAVIAETSQAANTILDNCDRMNALLYPEDPAALNDPATREKLLEELREGLQNIMLACSFQDIAGQRIRKTLDSINDIEDRITGALEGMGIGPESIKAAAEATNKEAIKSGNSQDDIDALFGN
jgi:chemotaxis protein CheZ